MSDFDSLREDFAAAFDSIRDEFFSRVQNQMQLVRIAGIPDAELRRAALQFPQQNPNVRVTLYDRASLTHGHACDSLQVPSRMQSAHQAERHQEGLQNFPGGFGECATRNARRRLLGNRPSQLRRRQGDKVTEYSVSVGPCVAPRYERCR